MDNIPEEYGLTKATGVFFDAVRHAKPILLPNFIIIPEELKLQCIRYNSISGLANMLIQYNKSLETYSLLQGNAYQNSLNFTIHNIRNQHYWLFKK